MDGYHPNAFLAKKLQTEGLLEDEDDKKTDKEKDKTKPLDTKETKPKEAARSTEKVLEAQKKRVNSSSEKNENITEIVIKKEEDKAEKRKNIEVKEEIPVVKKRRASPIVFDVDKKSKETERGRERTESASSDGHLTVTTVTNTHKYDAVPPCKYLYRSLIRT